MRGVAVAAVVCCAVHAGVVAAVAGIAGGWWAVAAVGVAFLLASAAKVWSPRSVRADDG